MGANNGSVDNTYATGSVTATYNNNNALNVGGLVGSNSGTIMNSFWDVDTTLQSSGVGADNNSSSTTLVGIDSGNGSLPNRLSQGTYEAAGWTFNQGGTWFMIDGQTRPFLQSEYSTTITNSHQLQLMAMNLSASYTLANNIDMASDFSNVSGMWATNQGTATGSGFVPLGTNSQQFTGSLDGQGHTISNLYIARPSENAVGLFGTTSNASISNVGLLNEAIAGNNGVGGLVGVNNGSLTNVYSSGSVSGNNDVGGLVGNNSGSLTNVYSTGSVSGLNYVGGLVGSNNGSLTNVYSTGSVSGNNYVGGLVGINGGSIEYSYATGSVAGSNYVGGLVGLSYGNINEVYSTGLVTGRTNIGGLVGSNYGTISSSFWDTVTTGQQLGFGLNNGNISTLIGLDSTNRLSQSAYAGWNFTQNGTWFMIDGQTRPFLQSEYSTTITNSHQLQLMAMNLSANYTLANSIDMSSEFSNVSGMWATDPAAEAGNGFVPIGTEGAHFTGTLDGLGHTINGLFIYRPSVNGQGLFGYGQGIRNLGLLNVDITGGGWTGGLVGNNYGNISNTYVTGAVRSSGSDVGGLVGVNYGSISNSYSTALVNGNYSVGGLVGLNSGSITNVYATGFVQGIGNYSVGGLVGSNSGTIMNSFWDVDTTLQSSGVGADNNSSSTTLVGIDSGNGSLPNRLSQGTYEAAGWTFNQGGTWFMIDGQTRPFLQSEYSTTITNSHQLQLMAMNLSASYTLANNIDMASDFSNVSGMWATNQGTATGSGFVPLGTNSQQFTGSFDGQGHSISGLTIYRPNFNRVGLFGVVSGNISNVALLDVAITGDYLVGGLVGANRVVGSISNIYVTGVVTGSSYVGGLVGANYGSINNSYATGPVTASNTNNSVNIGGLVGANYGSINNSYATGPVTASNNSNYTVNVGGLVGANYGGTINNSYSTGSVTASNNTNYSVNVGGLVGANFGGTITNSYVIGSVAASNNSNYTVNVGGLVGANYGSISNTYSTGSVTATYNNSSVVNVGGLVGSNSGTIMNSFWDVDTTLQSSGVGADNNSSSTTLVGIDSGNGSLPNRLSQGTYEAAGWTFNQGGTWFMIDGQTRPFLQSEYSTTITNSHQLQLMEMNLSARYTLANNIDMTSDFSYSSGMWLDYENGGGFSPVGSLNGSFNGMGHSITGLFINRSQDNVGLFGMVGSSGLVSNFSLLNLDVTGGHYGAGLAGSNYGVINNVHVTGSVNGSVGVGGLVGWNVGSIFNSDSAVHVVGSNDVGGLVGRNYGSGNISNSYAAGNVSGDQSVGGLVGTNYGSIFNSNTTNSLSSLVTGNNNVGGLVGNNHSEIYSSQASINVSGGSSVGGLVGYNSSHGFINYSFATGSVDGSTNVGGLVGYNDSAYENHDWTWGEIHNSYSAATVSGSNNVGGLVGINYGRIYSSFATGTVDGQSNIGGLVGYNFFGAIYDSNAYVTVTGTQSNIGGLVGYNKTLISNSYATGSVSGNDSVGGLVGYSTGTLEDSYASGSVDGNYNVGGLVGKNDGTLSNSFYDINTVMINGSSNKLTVGGIYDAQYQDWVSHSHQLDPADYLSQDSSGRYQIGSVQNLKDMLGFSEDYHLHFIQTSDIDLSDSHGFYIPYFAGTFDGAGKVFHNLTLDFTTINSINSNIGLFGDLRARTSNFNGQEVVDGGNLTGVNVLNANVVGLDNVGGLVGRGNQYSTIDSSSAAYVSIVGKGNNVGGLVGRNQGTINDSYATGQVFGTSIVGGLVGGNYGGTIDNTYFNGSVFSSDQFANNYGFNVGGLVGYNDGSIRNSNATGSVGGTIYVGGLVGFNEGSMSNNYSTGSVSASNYVGGLVGYNDGSISNSYATGAVSASNYVGGLIGYNTGTTTYSYSTSYVSGYREVGGLVGYNDGSISNSHSSSEVIGQYIFGGLVGYNQADGMIDNSYATGTITVSGDYTSIIGGLVGKNSGSIINSYATGAVTVSGDYSSGIGGLAGSNYGNISNSYATGSVISSRSGCCVGGLVGYNTGSITNSYATGNASGDGYVGGLVGENDYNSENIGSISNSYATGSVSGSSYVGGLVGANYSLINNSYSTGSVSGSSYVGGLVGGNDGSISNSFWNRYSSNQSVGVGTTDQAGVTGLTSDGIKAIASFSVWGSDINNTGASGAVWRIYEGNTAPLLTSFMTPVTLDNLTVNYNGSLQTGRSSNDLSLLVTPASGTEVGLYSAYSSQLGANIVGGYLTINAYQKPVTNPSLDSVAEMFASNNKSKNNPHIKVQSGSITNVGDFDMAGDNIKLPDETLTSLARRSDVKP